MGSPQNRIIIPSKYKDHPSETSPRAPSETGLRAKNKRKGMLLLSKDLSYYEIYVISRAILLASSIYYCCYYSLRYGPKEFTILENELVLPGFVYSKKAIVRFSYGYSTWNSIVAGSAAVMLVFSIISVSKTISWTSQLSERERAVTFDDDPFRNNRYSAYPSCFSS